MVSLDGYTDAIVQCIQKADNWSNGEQRLRQMEAGDRRLAEIDAKRRAGVHTDATAESHDRARVHFHGPKSFVGASA